MKLVKQSKLFFKEGNSDKVYEIDLCEVGFGQFVVNFRFGKRGSILKEGTKTDKPISLNSAEQVYDALEAEKRKKGYQTESEMFQPLPEVPTVDLPNANFSDNAIMKRLQGFVTGTNPFKTEWKASRVIWRAGELKLQEAVPFIIRLTDRGDEMQRYCALWALSRIGDASAERTMNVYFSNQKYTEKTRRIAGEGLLQVLQGDARQAHLNLYLNRISEDLKNVLTNAEVLGKILQEKISLNLTGEFDFLEDLYILSIDNQILKKELVAIFREIPLKANFFKPIRHILKIAEVRDDFEVLGLLSYRFERTLEMFRKPVDYYGYEEEGRESSVYISAINQQLKVKAELKKKNSRIAYSDRTRAYLIRRTLRQLKELGQQNQQEYVKLALSILLSYDSKTDFKAEYSVTEYSWQNGYRSYQKYFPAYSDAVFMNLILFGGGDRLTFNGKSWFVTEKNNTSISNRPQNTRSLNAQQDQLQGGVLNRVFDSVFSMFSKKKNEENQTPQTVNQPITPPPTPPNPNRKREELYPHLWDNIPQAYIQLLLKAKVDEIHGFAVQNLIEHPDYEKIKERIDFPLIHQFLASEYLITAGFGLELVKEKLTENPDKAITISLLNSPLLKAREFGLELIEKDVDSYLGESAFVTNLVFSKYEDVRLWATMSLIKRTINDVQQQLLVGRSIALLSTFKENNELNNAIIKDGTRILLKNCSDALQNVSNQVILDLLSSEVEAVQVFAVKIIILKNAQISAEMLCSLLASPFEQVRQAGSELLTEQKNRIATDKPFADALVNYLVPLLMKKEPYEGLHEDVSKLLRNQLVENLQAVDANTTIRLIHSNYVPAQDLGMVLLNKYVDANSLTMRQIINLANHEQVNIRQWSWNYFTKNIARIKFEREESIRLLDAKWDDSRYFAIRFFRDNFEVNDWTPEVLVGIADSVRPDIEAFGRELISRFFEDGQGEEYLLKLSQHPSLGVQLFATNYLERFAINDPEKLKNLDYYFRSVLTRVNKGRSSKSRIFTFLHQEALKSEASATIVSDILRDVSATVSIEDKATCITIMRSLQERFEGLYLPMKVVEFEMR
jgi:predicted DNA-binding WGR domain protein